MGDYWEADDSWYKSKLLIDNAAWNHREWPKLDLDRPATFMPWWHRARRWITDDRPCVERLLTVLEREVAPIPAWREEEVKRAAGLPGHWSVARASAVLAKALEHTRADSVAAKARDVGADRGFELYRWIYAKHKGVGPEQGQAAYRAVINPARCRNTLELRDSLDHMFRDIRECEAHGDDFKVSSVQRVLALEDRLPESLLVEMQNKMLQTYDEKLALVHHRVALDHQ